MWKIERYSPEKKGEWNTFIEDARNASFLFDRRYMDYHSDRYTDHSLIAYRNGKPAALLPANEEGGILFSHHGLTYGGWVLRSDGLDITEIYEMWRAFLQYCSDAGLRRVVYKPLPWIYAEMPSDEDRYMLFLCGASLVQTDISSAIDLEDNPGFDKLQKRHLKKIGEEIATGVIEADDREGVWEFYQMLAECLEERHDCVPVHSLPELLYLMESFPHNICLWAAWDESNGDRLLAGVLVYENGMCAHCQYIATTPEGREKNVMAKLVESMVAFYEDDGTRYFDFGISNEGGGRYLNPGLNRQKTSYGGSGVAYTRYVIDVDTALQNISRSLWPPK